jgi:hypothetical protein
MHIEPLNLDTSCRKNFVRSFPITFTNGAEVGVSSGDFAKNILQVAPNVTLYCIDVWEANYQLPNPEESYNNTIKNLTPYGNQRFKLIREGSPKSAERFVDEFFDFVYIDADHNFEPVYADIKAWYPKVKSGGVLFGHDYNSPWNGVIDAVNQWALENSYHVGVIDAKGFYNEDQDGGSKSWFIIKR